MVNQTDISSTPNTSDLDQLIHAPARLNIIMLLYVVESLDYVYLKNKTGLTWGNLATHLGKLGEAGYIEVQKGYQGKKPHSKVQLTPQGRSAFQEYRTTVQQLLDDLPE